MITDDYGMIEYKDIKRIDFETSSLCNAICPVCSRRANGGLKNERFTETYVTLEQAKLWFTEDILSQLELVTMCGNYGDSMTNPDLIPILQYMKSINPEIRFVMNTNASGRDEAFWRDLGEVFYPKGVCIFSVDGLEDTNHIYRRGTHWDKIITAMTSYISTGAKAKWEFLVFRHNEHQIDEATKLAEELGFAEFFAKRPIGFNRDNSINVHGNMGEFQYTIKSPIYEIGEHTSAEISNRNLGTLSITEKNKLSTELDKGTISDINLQLKKSTTPLHPIIWPSNQHETLDPNRELTQREKELGECDINCEAIKDNKIFINSNGLVFPCCYTASIYDDTYGDNNMVAPVRDFINSYGEETISLKHNSLEDIINGEIFTTGWNESFEDRDIRNKRLRACSVFCGKKVKRQDMSDTRNSLIKEKNLIMTEKINNFCTAPWTATYVDPKGDVKPCCIYQGSVGNLNENTFDEILTSTTMRNLKGKFINGEKPTECNACWQQEKQAPGTSLLETMWERYSHFVPDILDGTFNTIYYWDMRPSNNCNFGCVMCCHGLSSGHWQLNEDIMRPNFIREKFIEVKDDNFDVMVNEMKKVLQTITREQKEKEFQIYFAGGEPLLLEHHRNLLLWLVESKNTNVKLRYNTNCSTLKYKGTDFVDIWKEWKTPVVIDASIDSSGLAGEYQRHGSSWKVIKKNLTRLTSCSEIELTYNLVTSMITYDNLIETINELEEIDGEDLNKRLRFTPLVNPPEYDIRMMPRKLLNTDILDELDERGYNVNELRTIITDMYDDFDINNDRKELWITNKSVFDRINKYRNKNIYDILPWIRDINYD